MILTGTEIKKAVLNKHLIIYPFDEDNINPNSYNISIGNSVLCYPEGITLDTNCDCLPVEYTISKYGMVLKKNKFYFAMSKETVCSDYYVPILHNRSGVARKGLFTHITADLQQLHHNGKIMLQLLPYADTVIYPYLQIAQLSFWVIYS
jgi:dCTP deaminase